MPCTHLGFVAVPVSRSVVVVVCSGRGVLTAGVPCRGRGVLTAGVLERGPHAHPRVDVRALPELGRRDLALLDRAVAGGEVERDGAAAIVEGVHDRAVIVLVV